MGVNLGRAYEVSPGVSGYPYEVTATENLGRRNYRVTRVEDSQPQPRVTAG
jgi:hypothetical protein